MAQPQLVAPKQQIFVGGHALIRVRIELAADDPLDDNRRKPRSAKIIIQREKRLCALCLHDDIMHHAALVRRENSRVCALSRLGAEHRLIHHWEHAVRIRKRKQRMPLLRFKRLGPCDGRVSQRGVERFKKEGVQGFHIEKIPFGQSVAILVIL